LEAVILDVGPRPWGIGITADGTTLYTTNGPADDVSVVDAEKSKVVRRIRAGTSP
jgi:YVTN family beta-propeller protein